MPSEDDPFVQKDVLLVGTTYLEEWKDCLRNMTDPALGLASKLADFHPDLAIAHS